MEHRDDSVFNDGEWDCCFDFDAEDKNFGFRIDDFSFETVGDISCFDGVEVGFYDGVVGVADFDGVAVGDDGFFEGKECFADSCFSVDRFRPFFEHDVDLDVICVIGGFVGRYGVGNLLESTFQDRHGRQSDA